MSVVPGRKSCRAHHARQVFARNTKPAVTECPCCQDDRVVHRYQLIQVYVASDFYIAEERDSRIGENAVENPAYSLRALMVGRHAVPHEAKRDRETLQNVYGRL